MFSKREAQGLGIFMCSLKVRLKDYVELHRCMERAISLASNVQSIFLEYRFDWRL